MLGGISIDGRLKIGEAQVRQKDCRFTLHIPHQTRRPPLRLALEYSNRKIEKETIESFDITLLQRMILSQSLAPKSILYQHSEFVSD
jgi:hypothetical protein